MALDKIHGNLGHSPFIKPKDDDATSEKTSSSQVRAMHSRGEKAALGLEKNTEKRPNGVSFLQEGALGEDGAVYGKKGRLGGNLNLLG